MKKPILSFLMALLVAAGIDCPAWPRGGGGCLEHDTPILTPAGPVSIQCLKPGDTVWTVVGDKLQPGIVRVCTCVQPDEYLELALAGKRVHVTAEHPFQVEPGVFRIAALLRPGDVVWTWDGQTLQPAPLESVTNVRSLRPAYNLLVAPGGTYLADGVVVHNKGCFLPETPILLADGTQVPIRDVRPGVEVRAFRPNGAVVRAKVRAVLTHEVDEYVLLATDRVVLRVTSEHPFYVGSGTFRTLESLKIGDEVFVFVGAGLSAQRIVSLERIQARTRVYNLQTDEPHTFFANGIAVHNKGGGGGGCFPAGTPIRTPQGALAIDALAPGDVVLSIGENGESIATAIETVYAARSPLLVVETDTGSLRTTAEHPLLRVEGDYLPAGALRPGHRVMTWQAGRLQPAVVRRLVPCDIRVTVFNLRVGPPHTFVADGFVVHNKGGGGFVGSGHSSRTSSTRTVTRTYYTPTAVCACLSVLAVNPSAGFPVPLPWGALHRSIQPPIPVTVTETVNDGSSSSSGDWGGWCCFFILVPLVLIMGLSKAKVSKKDQDLDFTYSTKDVAPKAAKTKKLLDFLARQDPTMAPGALQAVARSTFLKLQECWQAREYGPMKPLLMPDLYAQHCNQLAGMKRDHEVNKLADLKVEDVTIVNVRYTHKPEQREFTALISASARDFYLDDRTQAFLRGDRAPARFQEFWTFHRQGNAWLLREVGQSREADALKEENFVELFTDRQLAGIYGPENNPGGPAGPWLEKDVETKATRTERLLNFLVETDKLWNRKLMLEGARQVFVNVLLAQEAGDPAAIKTEELFPDVAADLQEEISRRRAKGLAIEYRNLCVRKVELILVRNYADNNRDEFTVRISAHAQKVLRRGDKVISRDEFVTPFEQYWTFGRLDRQWRLKDVLPPAEGEQMISQENVDEESSPAQLQWYYKKTRAV